MTLAYQPDPDLRKSVRPGTVASRRLAGPRPEIALSWERSARSGVTTTDARVPHDLGTDRPSRLRRAAEPVVDRLARQLHGEPLVIMLADAEARVLAQCTGRPEVRAWLDALGIAPGARLAEEAIGTNAIGCAVEERRPFAVVGAEHYRESLRQLSGRAVPVRHLGTGAVRGALGIACRTEDDCALILPLVREAAAQVESLLSEDTSRLERLLLQQFLHATRRSSAAVVSLNRDLLISNTLAGPLVSPADQPFLWDWASTMLAARDEYCGDLRLGEDVVVQARCTRVLDEDQLAGIVIEMRPAPGPPPPAVRRRSCPGDVDVDRAVPGRSAAAARLRRELATMSRSRCPVLLCGEPGTGKTLLARRLHEMTGADGAVTVLDAAHAGEDGEAWFERMRVGVAAPGTLVLRHIDELPAALHIRAVSLVEQVDGGAVRLVATIRAHPDARGDPGDVRGRLRDHFTARLQVPPLRRRVEDVADIAQVLLRELAGRPARLEPTTLQALTGQTWPGNVRELRAVLSSALLRSGGTDIAIKHLPPEYRQAPTRHRLTSMQRAEREALLEALDDSGGNKQAAAELLGIARSTLYRKIRILGIDGRCLSG